MTPLQTRKTYQVSDPETCDCFDFEVFQNSHLSSLVFEPGIGFYLISDSELFGLTVDEVKQTDE